MAVQGSSFVRSRLHSPWNWNDLGVGCQERRAQHGIDAEERLEPRWVLVFDAKPSGSEAMTHMEECWLLCRRMAQVRLRLPF